VVRHKSGNFRSQAGDLMLLDTPAEKPNRSRAMAFTVAALALILAAALWFIFRYYPEKRATEHFLEAVVAGNMDAAFQLWKPGPSYQMNDFVADWGASGYYGPVKSYKIVKAKSPVGVSAVIVTVQISPYSPMPDASDAEKSRKTRVVNLWVDPSNKSFSFQP
jgi:hypothetical protein